MIIRNFDFVCATLFPFKADAVLIVDTDAVLTAAVSFQGFQMVSRRHAKIVQIACGFYLIKLAQSDFLERGPATIAAALKELLRVAVGEAPDHTEII